MVDPVDDAQLALIEAARDQPRFDGVGPQQTFALVAEVRRLREDNRLLRRLLLSKELGEYRYANEAAIDEALAAARRAHER